MSFTSYQDGLKQAQELGTKAIQIEASLSTLSPVTSPIPTLQKAFPVYITAAETYGLLLSSKLVPKNDIQLVKKKWRLILERAEKIKARIEQLGGFVGKVEIGVAGEELAVLFRGSTINGVDAPLWVKPESHMDEGDLFRESEQPELAGSQLELDPEWREIAEDIWRLQTSKSEHTMKQGLVSDCSIVAAMGVGIEHGKRFKTEFGWNNLFPQDSRGFPRYSRNGKHILKLLLNGAWRRITFDSLLPYSKKNSAPLYTGFHSQQPDSTAYIRSPWIPLALKGYFKAHGGYSLMGSSPGSDIYEFTGWIPERLNLKDGFKREKEWYRMKEAWLQGDVMVSLGTGEEVREGLVKRHAYGVVTLHEDEETRLLDIIDPGASTFSATWDNVCVDFEALYLNWRPSLRPVITTKHWSWPKPSEFDNGNNTNIINSQYRLRIQVSALEHLPEVWILLSQHVTSRDRPLDDIALHVFEVFNNPSQKTGPPEPERLNPRNSYINSTHVLVRYQLRRLITNLIVVPARDRGIYQTGFTLNVHAPENTLLQVEKISRTMPFMKTVCGSLTSRNAGGHPRWPTHITNPQYKLVVRSGMGEMTGRIVLQGDKNVPWNVRIVWGRGELVADLSENMVYADTGAYSYGMAYCEIPKLSTGNYTLIVSSFEPGQTGAYTLSFEATAPISITPLPAEGAGMFSRIFQNSWTDQTVGGRPSLGKYHDNPKVEVILPKLGVLLPVFRIDLSVSRLYLPTPSPMPINMTIFKRTEGGALGQQVATTGPYSDSTCGVSTGKIRLDAGIYIAVLSTYEPSKNEWVLKLWSDVAFAAEMIR
nr:calpain-like protease palB/RIM13 [Cryptococcus depauperatus CBS 7855]